MRIIHFFRRLKIAPERGAALIILVFFFITISIAIIQSATIGALSELRTYRSLATSKLSYVAAEAGIEDIFYRIITAKNIPTSETIVLNGATSTVTVVDVSSTEKTIWATGNANNQMRKIHASLSKNINASFLFGAQVGQWGVTIKEGGKIKGRGTNRGDVYSNGPILGSRNAGITGNITSSSGLFPDQAASSTSCVSDELVGKADPQIDYAQSFMMSGTSTAKLASISFYIKRVGNPDDAKIFIVNDDNGKPETTELAEQKLKYASVSTNYSWVQVDFTDPATLEPDTMYWVVFSPKKSNSKYWQWCRSSSDTYETGSPQYSKDWTKSSEPWTTVSGDMTFKTVFGGGLSIIDDVDVVGVAKADSINDSIVTGDAYFKSLTDSTVTGSEYSGSPTPPFVPLPISSSTIAQWEADATAGGIIEGDCGEKKGIQACDDMPLTLGPKQINGGLLVDGGDAHDEEKILTVTGTLYVKGNIIIQKHGKIRCAPEYQSSSCVIIADGYIRVKNGGILSGSGYPGSFVMLLSTQDGCHGDKHKDSGCTTNGSTIAIENNVDGSIFYSTNSIIDISNGAVVNGVVGYGLQLQNNALIEYDPAMMNVLFTATATTSPTGVWSSNRWNEY